MNETELLREIGADLQAAPAKRVLYLEGKTDVPMFFALLGVREPRDGVHDGVLVRGLRDDSGRGSTAVRNRAAVAAKHSYGGVYGCIDGDGAALSELAAEFDPPHAGPLFRWKAYAIENLLVKTGWPGVWGAQPDWPQTLLDHAPYVALNRIVGEVQLQLQTLRLAKHNRPTLDAPLLSLDAAKSVLEQDRLFVNGFRVVDRFVDEVAVFQAAVARSTDEGHAHVNGKWLVDVFAPRLCKITPQESRVTWVDHAIQCGGLPEAKALWQRILGRPV